VAEPFQSRTRGASPVARLLGKRARANLIFEIEDLLASAERITDIPVSRVSALAAEHGIDFANRLRTPRANLYRRLLEHCLLDNVMSGQEAADLAHMRLLLRLDAEDAARVHDQVARQVYGRAIDDALDDLRLDPEEEELLGRLRSDLDLPEKVAQRIYSQAELRARQKFIASSAPGDNPFFASGPAVLELEAQAETCLEDAVNAALVDGCRAVPGLQWAILSEIRAEIVESRVARWHVKLRAGTD